MRTRTLAIVALLGLGLGLWVLYVVATSADPSSDRLADPGPIEHLAAETAANPADNRGDDGPEGAARTAIGDAAGIAFARRSGVCL